MAMIIIIGKGHVNEKYVLIKFPQWYKITSWLKSSTVIRVFIISAKLCFHYPAIWKWIGRLMKCILVMALMRIQKHFRNMMFWTFFPSLFQILFSVPFSITLFDAYFVKYHKLIVRNFMMGKVQSWLSIKHMDFIIFPESMLKNLLRSKISEF
jgi:hypothetical protein